MLSDPFRAVLEKFDADEYKKCAVSAGALRSSPNPFIATHAALYEIKSLVELERVQEVRHRIDELLLDGGDDVYSFTYAAAEIAFLHGYALLGALQYGAATATLRNFLRDYPNASQRLRIGAEQMLAELANRQSGQIGEVVDLMDYSRRRLAGAESSSKVQERQARIIELLDTLIQDAEQQEQASSSSSGGGGQGGGKQRTPSKPLEQAGLPRGAPGSGEATRSARRANPAEAWGAMPPAQRERILQALRDSFPKRYRKLVEQYYEELAKKP